MPDEQIALSLPLVGPMPYAGRTRAGHALGSLAFRISAPVEDLPVKFVVLLSQMVRRGAL